MDYKIPLDKIIDCNENMYKIATVAIKEAERLTVSDSAEAEGLYGGSKLSSVALCEAFSGDIAYKDDSDKLIEGK